MNSYKLISTILAMAMLFASSSLKASQTDWMAHINGTSLISEISIPGTHDSGTWPIISPLAKTQHYSFPNQLAMGVRFFDVRLGVHPNAGTDNILDLHHAWFESKETFHKVVTQCLDFLKAHPKETIVMSVKHEWGTTTNFDSYVYSEIKKNGSHWWLNDWIPTLNQARGKIVLLRRFTHSGSPAAFGMDAHPSIWPDNRAFHIRNMYVEDLYDSPSLPSKKAAIEQNFNLAKSYIYSPYPHLNPSMFLTFTSAYDKFGVAFLIPITSYSDSINPWLEKRVKSYGKVRLGIVIMDFVSPVLANVVIGTN